MHLYLIKSKKIHHPTWRCMRSKFEHILSSLSCTVHGCLYEVSSTLPSTLAFTSLLCLTCMIPSATALLFSTKKIRSPWFFPKKHCKDMERSANTCNLLSLSWQLTIKQWLQHAHVPVLPTARARDGLQPPCINLYSNKASADACKPCCPHGARLLSIFV